MKVPRGSKSDRVPSEGSIVPRKGSGLRVLSKFQVKLPEGSKVPSKGSK